ncbi:MAG: acylphosphatase [Halobacteriota archaeon]
MAERIAAHVFVSGTVQGVFFRATTREVARDLGVDGWVQNLADGRVEAHFEGDPEAVAAMLEFCHVGSEAADVTHVEVEETDPEGFDRFHIRR